MLIAWTSFRNNGPNDTQESLQIQEHTHIVWQYHTKAVSSNMLLHVHEPYRQLGVSLLTAPRRLYCDLSSCFLFYILFISLLYSPNLSLVNASQMDIFLGQSLSSFFMRVILKICGFFFFLSVMPWYLGWTF